MPEAIGTEQGSPTYTLPQQMLAAAICAYSITPNGYRPNPLFSQAAGFVQPPHIFATGPSAIDAGLLGITGDGWAVISLRGTLSTYSGFTSFFAYIRDWLQDDETNFVPLLANSGTCLGGVHRGFHRATTAMWPSFLSLLMALPWDSLQGLRITGHSKGAGMAFLMAALANAEKGGMRSGGPKQIEVHAFAAPLAGNPDFANHYAPLAPATFRYQRAHDMVPFLAPYVSFDLLHQVDLWDARFDLELDAAIEYLRLTVTRGYELVGNLAFYPDYDGTAWPQPVAGQAGQIKAQAAILAAIKAGAKDVIADAHSAKDSYWPAIFGQDLPKPDIHELADQIEKEMIRIA